MIASFAQTGILDSLKAVSMGVARAVGRSGEYHMI